MCNPLASNYREEEFKSKTDQLRSKFSKEFFDKNINTDAHFRAVFDSLVRDGSPYTIIENLITSNQELFSSLYKALERQSQKVISKK